MPENQTKPNETQKTEENKTNEVQSLKEEQKKFEEHNYVEHILINEDGRHQAGNIHELEHKTTEVLDGSLLKQQTEVKKQQYTTDSQTVEEKKSFLDGKTKQTVQVQHVDLNGQAVMGIGLPVLKVDSPTPIIIARVSVIPDSSIIQPMKPCLLKSRKSTNFQPITPAPVQPVKLVQPIKSTLAQYPVPSTVQPNVPVLVQSTTPAPVKPTANASVQHTVPAVVQPSLSAPVQPTVNALVKPKEPVLVQPTIAQAMVSTQVQSTLPAVVQPTVTPPVQQTVPAPVQLIKLTPVQSLSPSPSLPLKPSLFASTTPTEPTKSWRAIAPKAAAKVSSVDSSIPKPPSADGARWPLGVVPMLWEVCLWRESKEHGHLSAYQLRWRSDYLMDYNGLRGSVVCMYCCSSLSVLKESSIKRHIIQKHPHTGNFTADERTTVINEWETRLVEVKKMVEDTKKSETTCDSDTTQKNHIVGNCDTVEEADGEKNPLISGQPVESKGASWEFAFGRVQGKAKDPRRYQHDQWKLEYLMDYTPNKDGLICMVCGVTLINPKISTVKMHIQQKHPDTTYLSDQEKAVVMEEWEQKMVSGHNETAQQDGEDEICIEINEESATSATNGSNVGNCSPQSKHTVPTSSKTSSSVPTLPPPCNSAKRNYQVSWRTEFMMDYDCRRQGLICMVCGGTLATLKVSTIKRHIVQVHPYSVDFTAEERQRILEAYSEMALHYIHSEECFKQQPQEEVKKNKRKTPADSK
ncbi:hypothetical protein GDO86_008578 [Hymenochirus boettgeri]|uniref:SPIN-DOC-like zinc-finger domain-containing protein n=1 Tax=Hymenochirus boettgeri TaxID=247094 RepID=A0A8T2IY50_9PIPI|nr:hypothetical protein GDO86_008578 [Hymenochirus boettgeri]